MTVRGAGYTIQVRAISEQAGRTGIRRAEQCMRNIVAIASVVVWSWGAWHAQASILAYDDSSDAAYSDGYPQWDSGDNGGYGFTAWTLSPANNQGDSGFFTASASQNGFAPSGGSIDTADGDSWGLYANGSASAIAYRGFDFNGDTTLDDLPTGGLFRIYMDNGWNDANVGLVLRTGDDTGSKNTGQRLEFLHTAGNNYRIIDSSGAVDTGIGWTDAGLIFELTLTSLNTYQLVLTPIGSSAYVFSGTLGGTADSGIQSVALYNEHAGNGSNFDLFFNRMEADSGPSSYGNVPEPGVLSLLVVAGLLVRSVQSRRRAPGTARE